MDRPEVERILRDADRRLAKGELVDLRLGFWRVVEAVCQRFADDRA